MSRPTTDLIGKQFDEWTVICMAHEKYKWICQCSCGNLGEVYSRNLKNGQSKSCGCYKIKVATKHGMYNSPEYKAWSNMKDRCYNSKHKNFHNYGNRGVIVCNEWLNSFEVFYTDMGARPSSDHSIERKHNDGNYEPGNCKWGTKTEQSRNTRIVREITFDNRTQCLSAWAEELNILVVTLRHRIDKLGWSIERALTEPVR